jgi:chitinase
MNPKTFVLALFLAFLLPGVSWGAHWVTAYYGAGNTTMPVSAIPWSAYTEVNHFAACPGANGTVDLHYLTKPEIVEFVAAAHAAGKKAIVTVMDGGPGFADATNPSNMAAFVAAIRAFIGENGYDGVDIDWERGIVLAQYIDLFARLRAALGKSALITIATGNWGGLEAAAARSQQYIDHINVMTYDMDMTPYTWHNDALFQNGDSTMMTADWRVRSLTGAGVANAKIGIGVPFYGRRWTGATEPLQKTGVRQNGWVNYHDLVTDPTRWNDTCRKWDAVFSADYISDSARNEFTSYNGVRSIQETIKWIDSQGFGGIFSFILDYEYVAGATGDARSPLSAAIADGMKTIEKQGK